MACALNNNVEHLSQLLKKGLVQAGADVAADWSQTELQWIVYQELHSISVIQYAVSKELYSRSCIQGVSRSFIKGFLLKELYPRSCIQGVLSKEFYPRRFIQGFMYKEFYPMSCIQGVVSIDFHIEYWQNSCKSFMLYVYIVHKSHFRTWKLLKPGKKRYPLLVMLLMWKVGIFAKNIWHIKITDAQRFF